MLKKNSSKYKLNRVEATKGIIIFCLKISEDCQRENGAQKELGELGAAQSPVTQLI